MDRLLSARPAPPLAWPLRLVLLLLMPAWLPILAVVIAHAILFAPAAVRSEDESASPDEDDDGRPGDHVPPLVAPRRRARSAWSLAERRPSTATPAPPSIAQATSPTLPPIELTEPLASCWPTRFPAG